MFFDDLFGGGMPGHGHGRGPPRDVDTDKFYEILNVQKNATEREIKKAWRKLCKTHHPDRGGDADEFKKIEAAYDVLVNSEKRSLYDQGGIEAVQQGGVAPSNIFDLFGGQGRGRQRDRGPQKPPTIKKQMNLTLEDVAAGGEKFVNIEYETADGSDHCTRCSGQGQYMETVRRGPMIMQSQRTCPRCQGRGTQFLNLRNVKKKLTFYVDKGVKNGDKQVLSDEGHQLPDMPAGDVVVQYRVKKHATFKRMGADLAMEKELTLVEALCGFEFLVKGLEKDNWLKVKSGPGQVVQPGDVIRIEEHGLPQKGASRIKGNLYIRFTVVLPRNGSLNEDKQNTLRQLLGDKSVKYVMPNQESNDTQEFETGIAVRLINLSNRPDLNGTPGIVTEANIRPGAHAVKLTTGQIVSVRQELLEITEKKAKKSKKQKPKKSDYVEDVVGVVVDMAKEAHTAHGVGGDEDDSDGDGQGMQCRQM